MTKWRRETILDVYNIVASAFLFASPWLFAFTARPMEFDAWLAGGAIALISLAAVLVFREWEEWLNLGLGCWLVAAPFLLGYQSRTALHVSIAIGAIVAYLAALELWLIHYGEREDGVAQGSATGRLPGP